MRVRIHATADTIVMTFVRPSPDVKLEGYILGYGSSVFSKQFIQLPENGRSYETEIDAEPKYLVAVQPIPVNDVKKHCTGQVDLEKPLQLLIGSLSPTAVMLSWRKSLKTPYSHDIMDQCLEEGFYTVRYRQRNRKWTYQTCPTGDTVIDHLEPNTPYEFTVRSTTGGRSGAWSRPVIHSTSMGDKTKPKPYKLGNRLAKPLKPVVGQGLFPPRPALHNRTRLSTPTKTSGAPHTTHAPPESRQETLPLAGSAEPKPIDRGNIVTNETNRPADLLPVFPQLLPPQAPPPPPAITTPPLPKLPSNGGSLPGQTASNQAPETPRNPAAVGQSQDGSSLLRSALANERARTNSLGQSSSRNASPRLPVQPYSPSATAVARSLRPASRNPLLPLRHTRPTNGQLPRGYPPRPAIWSRPRQGLPVGQSVSINKKLNQVGETAADKVNNFKQTDRLVVLKPKVLLATAKTPKPDRKPTTTTGPPSTTASRQESWEDSELFKSQPASDVDALGKKRYVAPHVIYQTGKKPDEPCSITSSLSFFPLEGPAEANVTAPPRSPPSNLTVVTVEGCPSFVILDWDKTDNDTTEYEVISTAKGPDGEKVSILTTDQTHTTVENLKPESSYEFKVKPKNELGAGPPSEPVTFNTESADPRVSENVSGKDAIWTKFPFKTDSYSDCHGQQYVKRTWYRKFVGVQLCNSLRYKIYLSDSLNGNFYNIGDQTGFGEDHCQFVDSFLDGRTGRQLRADHLPSRPGFYRAVRQEPVHFGQIGGPSHVSYVAWYECGTPIPGKW
ncbi:target of Nesh-SH3 isoform X1 [Perca flavescens]|uniref:target of Nesh-SH3 isoform X1 n=1 Tax=Perca flavescens TaxID=8167 RepID=UPI00106DE83D|nr:target of Nesh-SH3-like isoform X1 [Perca flavescens]